MTMLEKRVSQARWRLNANVLLRWLALGLLVATALWTAALLVERALVVGLPLGYGAGLAGLLAAGVAGVGAAVCRVNLLNAAATIDRAAGLKERLSSALVLRGAPDPFAQAVVVDAEQAAGRVQVPAHVPYRAPGLWPWSLAVLAMAVILALFMPELNLLAGQEDAAAAAARRAQAELERGSINQDLSDRFNRIRELAENHPALADLAEELKPLELPDDPTKTPDDIRREAAKRLDSVADRLAQKKDEADSSAIRETQRMLARLQPEAGANPAAELSRSLAAGDFDAARKSLEELQKKLEETTAAGDAESPQKLAEMQAQLKKLADQLAELDDALYLRKELENKGGLSEEQARKLLEELAKMDPKQIAKELQRQLADKGLSSEQIKELAKRIEQSQQAKKSCQSMGQCLAKAAQALQQCNSPGNSAGAAQAAAAAALSDAMSELSDMEMSEQLLAELEAQLADLKSMRDSVCQGGYCQGDRFSDQVGPQGPNYGRGIGSRIGKERTAHDVQPTKLKSRGQGGTVIGRMLVDGPQTRGQASAEVREAVNAAQRDAQDAIERDQVPRQYHPAVQKYFEQLAGLLRERSESAEGSER